MDDRIYTSCNKYERKNPMESFDMENYQSCNNCKWYTADRRCAYDMDFNFTIY